MAVHAPEQEPDAPVVVEAEPPRSAPPVSAPRGRRGKPDVLEVRCSPKMGLEGYTARMFLRIERPVELYCPKVTIRWPGGLESTREADCEPLEEGEEAGPWSSAELWPEGIRFAVPQGAYELEVEARVGKFSRLGRCKVEGQ